jgi:hypothetical protein
VVKSKVSPELAKKWIRLCGEYHPACVPESSITVSGGNPSDLKTLRVIDVQDECVSEMPIGSNYLALSYLWGQAPMLRLLKCNKEGLMIKGSLAQLDLHPPIPKTVSDSIELVSLIGERYLWIDCLSLVQDDEEDMSDGIAKMDLVYRGAKATVVATTGTDANAGLPGIRLGSKALL